MPEPNVTAPVAQTKNYDQRGCERNPMANRTKATLVGVIVGIVGTLATLAILGLAVVYSGAYNVAATEEHTSFVRWAFDTTFQNSIERRADGMKGM